VKCDLFETTKLTVYRGTPPPINTWCWIRHGADPIDSQWYPKWITAQSDEVIGNCTMTEMEWAGPIPYPSMQL
jgi:hypothetical protein